MTIVAIVLGTFLVLVAYFAVGTMLGPRAWQVGYTRSSRSAEDNRRGAGKAMQVWTLLLWPVTLGYIIGSERQAADEKAGSNPDGLTRRQRRDLAYQRTLTGILEQQHYHAEAALVAQKRSMDLQDRSPLNLAGRVR